MNLSEIYQNKIKKNSISFFSTGSNMPVIETKDPTINALENQLKETLQKILPQDTKPEVINTPTIRAVSFEDAIKELAQKNK